MPAAFTTKAFVAVFVALKYRSADAIRFNDLATDLDALENEETESEENHVETFSKKHNETVSEEKKASCRCNGHVHPTQNKGGPDCLSIDPSNGHPWCYVPSGSCQRRPQLPFYGGGTSSTQVGMDWSYEACLATCRCNGHYNELKAKGGPDCSSTDGSYGTGRPWCYVQQGACPEHMQLSGSERDANGQIMGWSYFACPPVEVTFARIMLADSGSGGGKYLTMCKDDTTMQAKDDGFGCQYFVIQPAGQGFYSIMIADNGNGERIERGGRFLSMCHFSEELTATTSVSNCQKFFIQPHRDGTFRIKLAANGAEGVSTMSGLYLSMCKNSPTMIPAPSKAECQKFVILTESQHGEDRKQLFAIPSGGDHHETGDRHESEDRHEMDTRQDAFTNCDELTMDTKVRIWQSKWQKERDGPTECVTITECKDGKIKIKSGLIGHEVYETKDIGFVKQSTCEIYEIQLAPVNDALGPCSCEKGGDIHVKESASRTYRGKVREKNECQDNFLSIAEDGTPRVNKVKFEGDTRILACSNNVPLETDLPSAKDTETDLHPARATVEYEKARGGANCPPNQMVTTEEECRIAGPAVELAFMKAVSDESMKVDRPAGCFWDSNGYSYFNDRLDESIAKWEGVGGICKKAKPPPANFKVIKFGWNFFAGRTCEDEGEDVQCLKADFRYTLEACANLCVAEPTCKAFQSPNPTNGWCILFKMVPDGGEPGGAQDVAFEKMLMLTQS